MSKNSKHLLLILCLACTLAQVFGVADDPKKFEITGAHPFATAKVGKEKSLEIKVEPDKLDANVYNKPNDKIMFDLTIGKCKMSISFVPAGSGGFEINAGNDGVILAPISLLAKENEVKFSSELNTQTVTIGCEKEIEFKSIPGESDSFSIEVNMEGDGVSKLPADFKLVSDALLYVRNETKIDDSSSLPLGWIIGGSIGGVAILIVIAVGAYFAIRCIMKRKEKKKPESKGTAELQLVTAKSAESKTFDVNDKKKARKSSSKAKTFDDGKSEKSASMAQSMLAEKASQAKPEQANAQNIVIQLTPAQPIKEEQPPIVEPQPSKQELRSAIEPQPSKQAYPSVIEPPPIKQSKAKKSVKKPSEDFYDDDQQGYQTTPYKPLVYHPYDPSPKEVQSAAPVNGQKREIKPRKMPLTGKEQQIADLGLKRDKEDYPTMEDVMSDWDSVKEDTKKASADKDKTSKEADKN